MVKFPRDIRIGSNYLPVSLDNPVWKSVWLKTTTTELKSSIIHKSLLVISFNFLIHQFNRPSREKNSIYI